MTDRMSPKQVRQFVERDKATILKASRVAWEKVDFALDYTERAYDELETLRRRVAELEAVSPEEAAAKRVADLEADLKSLRGNLGACVDLINLRLED